jgi:hypothetical protein
VKPTKESYLYTKILFFAHKDTYLFLQVLPHSLLAIRSCPPSPLFSVHSSNARYTYNGLGIISFHKDGVLTGSRMLCLTLLWFFLQATRHARRVYVGGLPPMANEQVRKFSFIDDFNE